MNNKHNYQNTVNGDQKQDGWVVILNDNWLSLAKQLMTQKKIGPPENQGFEQMNQIQLLTIYPESSNEMLSLEWYPQTKHNLNLSISNWNSSHHEH